MSISQSMTSSDLVPCPFLVLPPMCITDFFATAIIVHLSDTKDLQNAYIYIY
ncbi:hypothetical protein BD408DRAFT_417165 [Parasitella parasitica]|nr:hypothetical protein BD408DRAFT_417165 [Parasitella parasitica]